MFARAFTREARTITASSLTWGDWQGDAPTKVTTSTAMQLLAVYGCVKLITDSISTLPIDCYTSSGDTHREVAKPVWLTNPTVDLEFGPWCTQALSSVLLAGNAFVAVLRNANGQIVEIPVLDPTKVELRREAGRLVPYVGGMRYVGELLHIPAMMLPGADVGLSPVEYARQTIELGISAQDFGKKQFDQGLWMPGVVEIPGDPTPDQMRDIAKGMGRKLSKGGGGLPGVLSRGAAWKPTGLTPEQGQFLETRQFTDAQIAGQLFLIDPSELGIAVAGSSLTYQNLESRNIRLLQRSLLPWIVRLEKALSSLMFQPRYVKFNVDGLLRGDTGARWTQYAQAAVINTAAVAIGMDPVQTTEEMRRLENWNPVEWTPQAPVASGGTNAAA